MERVFHVVPGAGSALSSQDDFNQERDALELRLARVRAFRSMSPSQQRAKFLAGRANPREDVYGALRDLTELLRTLP